MMEENTYLTPEGADSLRKEVEELKGPRRDELAARLRHAVEICPRMQTTFPPRRIRPF